MPLPRAQHTRPGLTMQPTPGPSAAAAASPLLDAHALGKLRWRCRRGLLENDLFIERFFARHQAQLTERHAQGLYALMELADQDLLDLLLRRSQPQPGAHPAAACEVLALLRGAHSPGA